MKNVANDYSSLSNNGQDHLSTIIDQVKEYTPVVLSAVNIVGKISSIVTPLILWYLNRKDNQQKDWDEIKIHIDRFLETTEMLNPSQIKGIREQIILPILNNKNLGKKITETFPVDDITHYQFSFHMDSLMRLAIMWASGILFYRQGKGERLLAEKALYLIFNKIGDPCKTTAECSKLFPEFCVVYGRIIDSNARPDYPRSPFAKLRAAYSIITGSNDRPHDAIWWFKRGQESAKGDNSFVVIIAERLLLWADTNKIANIIKDTAIKYCQTSETCNKGLQKDKKHLYIEKKHEIELKSKLSLSLIESATGDKVKSLKGLKEQCIFLLDKYDELKKVSIVYFLSYLNHLNTGKETSIVPKDDAKHKLKCDIPLLYLSLYTLILNLLLDSQEDIPKTLEKMFASLTSVKDTYLDKNTNSNMEINIIVHSQILDVVYVIYKLFDLSIVELTQQYKRTLNSIEQHLKKDYSAIYPEHIKITIDNAKFHCMYAKAYKCQDNHKETIHNLSAHYPECLSMYASNILSFIGNSDDSDSGPSDVRSLVTDASSSIQLSGATNESDADY